MVGIETHQAHFSQRCDVDDDVWQSLIKQIRNNETRWWIGGNFTYRGYDHITNVLVPICIGNRGCGRFGISLYVMKYIL